MKNNYLKTLLVSSALMVSLAPFAGGMNVNAQPNKVTSTPLAELFGEYNFTSTQTTSVIIELNEQSIVQAKHSGKAQTKANHKKALNQVKADLQQVAKTAVVNEEYDYVFSGFSVEVSANEIPALLAVPGVKAVYPNVEYTVTSVGEGAEVEEDAISPAMLSSAPHVGANKAWESGYTGKGVKVAVIDTGVDYTHPDLDQAFGEYKGYDFVDKDNNPQETPKGDPRGAQTDHGSHVAGTIAANGAIKGVAPEATLLAYRVLGPGGRGSTDNVIAGIEQAVEDGADVMNLSLGNSINDPDYATSIALDWAMAEGVVAVTSNGNSGPNSWTVGSPGAARQAISVGATQLPYNIYSGSISTTGGESYPSAKVQGFPSDAELLALSGKEFEFVNVGMGAAADFAGKDVKGKIALISRGAGIAFFDKAANAKNAGAVGAIIYNNVAGETPDVAGMPVPTIKTTLEDGNKLLAELEKGNNKVSFTIQFDKGIGETIASFSSRGPAFGTWMIKPDVSAPGVNITSTIPTHNAASPHGYGSKQGTSMASPHVAGAAALLLQAHPTYSVDDVKAALMNTAEKLIDPATGKAYPHNFQGAGGIRVVEAINADTLVTPGSQSFGTFYKDKGKQVATQSFALKNLSSKSQNYSFKASFGENFDAIKVSTSSNLLVNAGQSQQVQFNVQVDAGKLEQGYYEGSIEVSNGTETFDVPTILFIKEPDYPRVTSLGVTQVNANQFDLYGYFPTGAEEAEITIYKSNAAGQNLSFVGPIATLTNVSAGYIDYYTWDGTVNGVKLEPGYYNVYVNATNKGVTTQAGVNFQIK
jgi:minor extracellular serine protease Vpr